VERGEENTHRMPGKKAIVDALLREALVVGVLNSQASTQQIKAEVIVRAIARLAFGRRDY
jgi:hypothetical protein